MEEKKNNNTFLKVLVVVLLLIICFGLGWFGKDYIQESDKSEKSSSNNNQNNNSEKVKEVELDIHSSLVQLLYNEVSYDQDEPEPFFGGGLVAGGADTFIVKDASEIDKMRFVAKILKGHNKWYVSPNEVPDRNDVGHHSVQNVCSQYNDYYYTKDQVEKAYHQLYGSGATLDTSVIMNASLFDLERYAYDANTNRYYSYYVDGGGTSGPGGYTSKLVKAVRDGDNLVLYQDVELHYYGGEKDEVKEKFQLVYTFNNEKENEYVFVSRVKKA